MFTILIQPWTPELYSNEPASVFTMNRKLQSFAACDVARFRLTRHHFLDKQAAGVVSICTDICGAQAQLMTAANLQLWARNHALRRVDVDFALSKERALIKTHLMRQTLHLIAAADFSLYIAALKSCRVADALRIMRRFGISDEEGHSLTPLILDALSQRPLNRTSIAAALRPKVSKRVQAWMGKVWSIVRIPMAEGLLCYGPGEDNEVTLTRTDSWLKKQRKYNEKQAITELLRRYLRAYGPATIRDFGHWAGLPAPSIKPLPSLLGNELCEVLVDGRHCLLLGEDLPKLTSVPGSRSLVRLLPHFDPYLLAHRDKDHLIPSRHYKRVYRNQGWISPVVLFDGAVTAIWSYKRKGATLQVSVEPFQRLERTLRSAILEEAECLAGFFSSDLEISFTAARAREGN